MENLFCTVPTNICLSSVKGLNHSIFHIVKYVLEWSHTFNKKETKLDTEDFEYKNVTTEQVH